MNRALTLLNLIAGGLTFAIPPAALDAFGAWGLVLGLLAWLILFAAIGHNLDHLNNDPKETHDHE